MADDVTIVTYVMFGVALFLAILVIGGCILIHKAVKQGIKKSPKAQQMIQKGAEIARTQYKDELERLNKSKK